MTDQPWLKRYDPGVPAHLDYPPMPVFDLLDAAAGRCPERACLVFKDRVFTYRQVADQSDHLAAAIRGLGIVKGDRVGIFMPNAPEFILAFFAILKAGGVVVAINPLYTPPEIVHQVNDAGLEMLFCAGELYERLQAARPQTGIRQVVVAGEAVPLAGDLHFDELVAQNPAVTSDVKNLIGPDDLALFQYTGGTTGVPKAAVARHRNLVANALQFKAWMSTLEEEKETFLLALPVYHIYGMVCGMLLGMALRATLVVLSNPRDIPNLLHAIQEHRVTYFPAAPTLYNAINNHPDVQAGRTDLSSVKACISGSAPLMKETKEGFERLTGGRIVEGYGLSEAPTATHCNPLQGDNRLGSIGLPLPDVDAKIVSLADSLTELPAGEPGELVIRSPQVMLGYHNMPGETALALRDGWLYTGDIARMDANGYFYIIDRKKEMIKPGGMEVWPREVEEVIASHPKVVEAAVAGIPDAYRGETVKAWVVVRPGETLEGSEIRAWCRERLAPFKIPAQVEFRAQLPKSNIGKILRRELVRQDQEKTAGVNKKAAHS
jgi:long-chain acyl-CoA synthetase